MACYFPYVTMQNSNSVPTFSVRWSVFYVAYLSISICPCTPLCCSVSMSVCHAVSAERPAPTLCSALSPSDSLDLCQERMIVFESCRDVKRGRSPGHGRVSSKPAPSWKVGGNMASQSAPPIGLPHFLRKWMDLCFPDIAVESILLWREPYSPSQFRMTYWCCW